uniref:C2 domain-containing protein n=1 Tax=Trichobilharzia regenti TaxID=157069 RepID=A0AA85JL17_TRIRE|nr:unnamed protein product [Trichobilharzia regenti]
MGGALSSADDISELSSDSLNNTKQNTKLNKKGKNASSTDAGDDGKPKILPLEEYAAQLKRMTSEIDSIDEDSDGGEGYYSGEDKQDILSDGDHHDCGYDQNDDDDIQSFILPYSSRLQLAISYSDADQEMQVNVIRANDIPGADSGGPPAYQIYLCVLPDSERQWKSKLRTAPNPEFLEQWTFNIPLISIHQSTLLCTIIGHYGVGKEFPYGNAILPMEKLNLNTENVLTLHFEPKYVHAAYLTPLSSTKLQKETNDSEAPQNLQIIPVDRPTLCPENENITALNVQLPKVLLSLRLNPDTGRLECCLQQITLVDLRVGNRIPKRSIFVKIVIRTEEEGKLAKTHSGYHERQSTIHMNETLPLL